MPDARGPSYGWSAHYRIGSAAVLRSLLYMVVGCQYLLVLVVVVVFVVVVVVFAVVVVVVVDVVVDDDAVVDVVG